MILKSLAPGACTPDKSYVLSLSYVPSLLSVCRICTTIQSITTCVVLTESTVEGPTELCELMFETGEAAACAVGIPGRRDAA
jgi:hypothetical protein